MALVALMTLMTFDGFDGFDGLMGLMIDQPVSTTNRRSLAVCIAPQTSFEMTFVAKGYSKYWASKPAVQGAVEGVEEGDPDAVESATVTPPVPEGGPDVTVVTVVKGPEPGELLLCASLLRANAMDSLSF